MPSTDYATPRDQVVSAPGSKDMSQLDAQRRVVRQLAAACGQTHPDLSTFSGVLQTLQRILDSQRVTAKQTYELQCLGIVLGDALVLQYGAKWVVVEDSVGRDPAIRWRDNVNLLFPLTMISKRVERGETFDVARLATGIADELDRRSSKR